ncbi:gp16 family protein [Sphingomonas sp. CJ99]
MNAPAQLRSPADQRRNAMLAKVHLGAKDLGLVGDAYLDLLFGVTGKDSAKKCTDAELSAVLDRLKGLGWKPASPRGRTGERRQARAADHKVAAKARALWISLYHLGAIDDAGEMALEAFARRQLKCERLQFADQRLAFRLIEALKAMAERHGWSQSTEGLAPGAGPIVLRRRLVERIMALLADRGVIPAHWRLTEAAWRLCGIEVRDLLLLSSSELDDIAAALGAKLREFGR